MKHISELFNAKEIEKEEVYLRKEDIDPNIFKVVDYIFKRLQGIIPAINYNCHDEDTLQNIKKEWVRALAISKITDLNRIDYGLDKLSQSKPTFLIQPYVFMDLCRPSNEEYGFLEPQQAFVQANIINRQFAEIPKDLTEEQIFVIKHAIQAVGAFEMRNNAINVVRPQFIRAYEMACEQYISGEIKPILKPIDHKPPKDDGWKTLRYYGGILPQYAHLTSRDLAMPVIKELLAKNDGSIIKKLKK